MSSSSADGVPVGLPMHVGRAKRVSTALQILEHEASMTLLNMISVPAAPIVEPPPPAKSTKTGLYKIEKIVDHRGEGGAKKSAMQFRVRWDGFGPDEDTWEGWTGVRKTLALHSYLHEHSLLDLL